MKKLLFPILLLVVSNSIMAQVPGFEKVFRWGYGPVTTIEGNEEAVFYTSGSNLITGILSASDSLLEVAKLDLGESVSTSFLSGDRLYLLGRSFFIINISNRYQPTVISKTPVSSGVEQEISVLGSVAFLRNSGLLSVYDISDEAKPKYSTRVPGYINSFTIAGGQLCYVIDKTIYIASLQNPLQPVVSDSIQLKQNAYSFCLAGKDNHLFVGSTDYKNKMLVYSNSESTRFELTDSLDLGQGGEFIKIKGQFLGYFELGWGGYILGLFDISDIKKPTAINSQNSYFHGNSFCIGDNYLISTDGSYGLNYYSKQTNTVFKLKFRIHEAGYMVNPKMTKGELHVPESGGYRSFELKSHGLPIEKYFYFVGPTDLVGRETIAIESFADYLYVVSSEGVFLKHKEKPNEYLGWITNNFDHVTQATLEDSLFIVLSGKTPWSSFEHSILSQYSLKDPSDPKQKSDGGYFSNFPISSYFREGNRIFLCSPDSGVLVYSFPFTGWDQKTLCLPLGKNDKPETGLFKDDLVILNCKNKIVIFREVSQNQFERVSEIQLDEAAGSIQIVKNKLFVLSVTIWGSYIYEDDTKIRIYSLENPESPVFEGSFDQTLPVTGIGTENDFLVVTHGSLGYTLFKYKSVPDGVEEPSGFTPQTFSLKPNYPNPFNPETRIPFTLPGKGKVTFKTYSVLGQLVKEETLEGNPGLNSWLVNLENQSSGIYLVKGTYQNRTETVKILLVK
ncbi:MAG: T9SS type A sorting domain-containing protein [Bacteroidetes bacterium]|nr:T9SS type A sorting domain-containing protein [Bacteroidota bacterium]